MVNLWQSIDGAPLGEHLEGRHRLDHSVDFGGFDFFAHLACKLYMFSGPTASKRLGDHGFKLHGSSMALPDGRV